MPRRFVVPGLVAWLALLGITVSGLARWMWDPPAAKVIEAVGQSDARAFTALAVYGPPPGDPTAAELIEAAVAPGGPAAYLCRSCRGIGIVWEEDPPHVESACPKCSGRGYFFRRAVEV